MRVATNMAPFWLAALLSVGSFGAIAPGVAAQTYTGLWDRMADPYKYTGRQPVGTDLWQKSPYYQKPKPVQPYSGPLPEVANFFGEPVRVESAEYNGIYYLYYQDGKRYMFLQNGDGKYWFQDTQTKKKYIVDRGPSGNWELVKVTR